MIGPLSTITLGVLLLGEPLNLLRWALTALILLPLAWRALLPLSRLRERWPYLLALGVLLLGEPLNLWIGAGTLLVLTGVWLLARAR